MKGRPSSRKQKQTDVSATLSVRIQPRASKNGVTRMEDGSLKIRLTAPPVDGAANEALIKFLSDTLSVGRSQVEIVSGHTGRQKIVRIGGMNEADVIQLLNTARQ
ncbi:MAG: DUF167 domain-containing protein [Nitrospirota bacterium]